MRRTALDVSARLNGLPTAADRDLGPTVIDDDSTDGFSIVGAGPAGLLMALSLNALGLPVRVLERRPGPSETATGVASFNFTLTHSTLRLLDARGIDLSDLIVRIRGRQIWTPRGDSRHRYGLRQTDWLASVPRGALIERLLTRAESAGIPIEFGATVRSLDAHRGRLQIENQGGTIAWRDSEGIIAADGSDSICRNDLVRQADCDLSRQVDGFRYVTATIDPDRVRSAGLPTDVIHFAPGRHGIDIGIANRDGSLSLLLERRDPLAQCPEADRPRRIESAAEADSFVVGCPDVLRRHVDALQDQLVGAPIRRFKYATPHRRKFGNAVLIGDAGRTLPPYLGKGVNDAIADVETLTRCIDRNSGNWKAAIAEYSLDRAEYVRSIERLARRQGRILLSGRFGDAQWRLHDRLERLSERIIGHRSLYQRLVFDYELSAVERRLDQE